MAAVQVQISRYLKMDKDLEISSIRLQAMIDEINAANDSNTLATSERKLPYPVY